MSKRPLPEALCAKEVAQLLGVHPLTVKRWVKIGYIAAYRVGPVLVRIPRSEVSRLRKRRIASSIPLTPGTGRRLMHDDTL